MRRGTGDGHDSVGGSCDRLRAVHCTNVEPKSTRGRQLEHTIEEFHGDQSRIYLTGFSMGGAGTYRMAHRWPDRFAALLVVTGPVESWVGTRRRMRHVYGTDR
jgi:poly(3-hydroxybutyrate) depolymerase